MDIFLVIILDFSSYETIPFVLFIYHYLHFIYLFIYFFIYLFIYSFIYLILFIFNLCIYFFLCIFINWCQPSVTPFIFLRSRLNFSYKAHSIVWVGGGVVICICAVCVCVGESWYWTIECEQCILSVLNFFFFLSRLW